MSEITQPAPLDHDFISTWLEIADAVRDMSKDPRKVLQQKMEAYAAPIRSELADLRKKYLSLLDEINRLEGLEGDGWIPVSDDVPPEGQHVLICTGASWVWQAWRRGDWFETPTDKGLLCLNIGEDVTHWQPLPKPPEITSSGEKK